MEVGLGVLVFEFWFGLGGDGLDGALFWIVSWLLCATSLSFELGGCFYRSEEMLKVDHFNQGYRLYVCRQNQVN